MSSAQPERRENEATSGNNRSANASLLMPYSCACAGCMQYRSSAAVAFPGKLTADRPHRLPASFRPRTWPANRHGAPRAYQHSHGETGPAVLLGTLPGLVRGLLLGIIVSDSLHSFVLSCTTWRHHAHSAPVHTCAAHDSFCVDLFRLIDSSCIKSGPRVAAPHCRDHNPAGIIALSSLLVNADSRAFKHTSCSWHCCHVFRCRMSVPVMQPSPEELRMLAKEVGAVLPQNVHPWSYQLALESAFIPFGTSVAAAIVVCCLFFLFFCAGLANYLYTKYAFYDVLCISTACRSPAHMFMIQLHLCGARHCPEGISIWPHQIITCVAVRTAAFACRAAYLVRYRPALNGTWLAFNNAGFGANIATLCFVMGTW